MATGIKIGQRLEGKLGSYFVTSQLHRNAWSALCSDSQSRKVVIKTAPTPRLHSEANVLGHFQGRPHIRQLIDETNNPLSIVLQYLDDNLLDMCAKKAIEGPDLKYVAKRILQALQELHDAGLTHTDVKPDNILVNHSEGPVRFADVELADFGDVQQLDPEEYLKIGAEGPHMGAAVFRSPEAMIKLRWGPSTDIWSFGATLISLLWGLNFHIFKPKSEDAKFDDDEYLLHVLIRQISIFGPVPASYASLIADEDDDRWEMLGAAVQFVIENNRATPFEIVKDPCLTEEHREFILKIMKIDPRDRPTAAELLKDKWFDGVA